jgi:hypothetical protein
MRKRLLLTASTVLSVVSLAQRPALADVESCVHAHANGQRESKAGHLKSAAQLYTSCGSDLSCPEKLRSECGEMLESVRRLIPSVIFSVTDASGADTSAVKVYAGEALVSDGLDGRAVELDPGKYHLRFELAVGGTLTSDIVVREGEKNRVVYVKAEPQASAAPAPALGLARFPATSAPAFTPLELPAADVGPPVGAWVATGVAVVGFATFGTFALLGREDRRALDDCSPNCPSSERDRRDGLKAKYLVADIGLGVGAASAVLAGVLFVTASSKSEQAKSARALRGFDLGSDAQGARVWWRGQF